MWRKRQRDVFRKRSRRGRVLLTVTGASVLIALIWFTPGLALFPAGVDTTKAEYENQNEQASVQDQQPEQPSTDVQPEQEPIEEETKIDRPEDEKVTEIAPPLPSTVVPETPPVPASPLPDTRLPSSAPLSPAPRVEEVPKDPYPVSYSYYYEPNYYWDYDGSDYYSWGYWDY